MTAREQIKNWFKKGLKPTEAQFHEWIDSYWHKQDILPNPVSQQPKLVWKMFTARVGGVGSSNGNRILPLLAIKAENLVIDGVSRSLTDLIVDGSSDGTVQYNNANYYLCIERKKGKQSIHDASSPMGSHTGKRIDWKRMTGIKDITRYINNTNYRTIQSPEASSIFISYVPPLFLRFLYKEPASIDNPDYSLNFDSTDNIDAQGSTYNYNGVLYNISYNFAQFCKSGGVILIRAKEPYGHLEGIGFLKEMGHIFYDTFMPAAGSGVQFPIHEPFPKDNNIKESAPTATCRFSLYRVGNYEKNVLPEEFIKTLFSSRYFQRNLICSSDKFRCRYNLDNVTGLPVYSFYNK